MSRDTTALDLTDPTAVVDHLYELALDYAEAEIKAEQAVSMSSESFTAAMEKRSAARKAMWTFRMAVVEANR